MAQIKVSSGGSITTREFDEKIFGERVLGRTLKEAVVMYEANQRAGTVETKERGDVAGPNKKLWKQKHTGRARMGTPKSPLWRGGGTIFGPHRRDHSYHMPLKARRVALASALLSKFQDGEVVQVESFKLEKPSTKTAVAALKAAAAATDALVVTETHDPVLVKSLRNVPSITVRAQADLNAWDVLHRKNLVITAAALEGLRARFQKQA
jgi:large subunit ribosomal protein L4